MCEDKNQGDSRHSQKNNSDEPADNRQKHVDPLICRSMSDQNFSRYPLIICLQPNRKRNTPAADCKKSFSYGSIMQRWRQELTIHKNLYDDARKQDCYPTEPGDTPVSVDTARICATPRRIYPLSRIAHGPLLHSENPLHCARKQTARLWLPLSLWERGMGGEVAGCRYPCCSRRRRRSTASRMPPWR